MASQCGLIFSLGENFGKDWTLTSRDGSQVSGRGEGGVFWSNRMAPSYVVWLAAFGTPLA